MRVEPVIEAVEMEPLLVVTSRQLRPDIPGWDYRRRMDLGTFITREEIDRPGIMRATDVLRQVPSVQLFPRGHGLPGNDVFIRGCRPLLFVDGTPIAEGSRGLALDDVFGPEGLEAMEVYSAGVIPPDFGFGSNDCGAVIVWTRRSQLGGSAGDRRSSWKWFSIAAGVFAALLFMSR